MSLAVFCQLHCHLQIYLLSFKIFSMFRLLIICQLVTRIYSECEIDPLELRPTPLIVRQNMKIIYPDFKSRFATLTLNEEILVACPGNQLLLNNSVALGEVITVVCSNDGILTYYDQPLNFYSLKCQDIPKNVIKYTGRTCQEGQEVEIGFHIANGNFVRQIQICFDNINFTPIFSHYNLTKNIAYRDGKVPRSYFQEDGFYSIPENLDTLYRRDFERKTINQQLNLDENSHGYIKENNDERFINRGHLTAKGDFVYGFQQVATFHYVNSAPQWAAFNGGNWNDLEISVRQLASSENSDLEIYTGIYGVTSLRQTELFLYANNGRYFIKVPQLFWKLVYNRSRDKGIVVLGVNNVYEFSKYDVICNDISDRVSWFSGKLKRLKGNVELGYVYACSISDFCRQIRSCPISNGQNLLL